MACAAISASAYRFLVWFYISRCAATVRDMKAAATRIRIHWPQMLHKGSTMAGQNDHHDRIPEGGAHFHSFSPMSRTYLLMDPMPMKTLVWSRQQAMRMIVMRSGLLRRIKPRRSLNRTRKDRYNQPQRPQRYAEDKEIALPSAYLCGLCGSIIHTNLVWSDLDFCRTFLRFLFT